MFWSTVSLGNVRRLYFLSWVAAAQTTRLIGKPQFTVADNGLEVIKLVLRIVVSSSFASSLIHTLHGDLISSRLPAL